MVKDPDAATRARWSRKHLGRILVNSREITDGWCNTIHVLLLDDGSRDLLKVSLPSIIECVRYERNIMAAEAGPRFPRVLPAVWRFMFSILLLL